ncbi:lipoprotein [Pedobacter immunditicola]
MKRIGFGILLLAILAGCGGN